MEYVCGRCGKREPVTSLKAHCDCGGLWQLDYRPPRFRMEDVDRGEWSQFRYREYMPFRDEAWRGVSLGEGLTPVIRMSDGLWLKMDYFMPTLSFKDRGAAALIAHCKAIGVDRVVQDSSGNAGNAVAAYCGRAGISCEIMVPEGASPQKIAMIRAHGAVCTVVPGSRDHCAEVCREKVEKEGVFYASHVYNPFFYQGTKTCVYEIFEQLGRMPRHLLLPVGNGTLFLGAVLALEHLLESGCIERMPQLIAFQAEACDPLLRAAAADSGSPAAVTPGPTLAEGIAIGRPARGREILALSRKYGVRFVHAPEADILPARAALARRGVYCEHTAAAGYAAYLEYCRSFGAPEDCLLVMSGAGLKSDH